MSRNLQHWMVAALLLSCAGSASAGLVAHWTLDETSGTIASDSGPNRINGTLNGNSKWVPGKIGGALEFDGDGDFVDCGNAAPLNIRDEITLACWIKIASFTRNWEAIIAKGDNSYRMSRSATTGNSIHFGLNGPTGGNLNANKIVTDNEWHHVALVYDGANKIIYLDGIEDARVASTGQISVSTYNLHIGDNSQQANRGLKGVVDDVRLYDRGASAGQVKELAANGTDPTWPKAWQPNPANGAVGVNSPLFQWTKGENAIFHNVYLGTTPELTEADLGAKLQPFAMYFHQQPLVPGTTYYWRVDEVELDMTTIHTGDVWSFTMTPLSAWQPVPADKGGGVSFIPTLQWNPGQQAIKHRMYLSANFADVNSAAAAAGQGEVTNTSFAAPLLRASTTYFWRVDEVKADGTAEPGPVWSFTTADAIAKKIVRQWWTGITGTAVTNLTGNANYPNNPTGTALLDTFEGPVSFADNYGTRLYGWLTPPQSGDYTFWIASDDSSELRLSTDATPANTKVIASVSGWTSSKQWDKFPTQKSAAITLQAGQKYYIQALQKDGTGGDNIAVSWQGPGIATQMIISAEYVDTFALPPLQAFAPNPANGGVDAPQSGALSWSAGEKAQKHDVYFGEDQAAVAAADTKSPLYKGQQAGTTLDAGNLEWGKVYYWRVDEINAGEADSPWKGTVWSFTTANFIQVDNFESYTDDEGVVAGLG
ncbi:MAG: PA14 domain-containing protein, partial [Planctomycetes bacterium]|nr:PA14 domain-containing protein [Planctomycetota bacterium]